MQEIVDGIVQELRRGSIIIAVLSQLKSQQYGYSLISNLDEIGFKIDQGTLYPLLRRLEQQKILSSTWDTDQGRPKKYYILTEFGYQVYNKLQQEFTNLTDSIKKLMEVGNEFN